VGTSNRHVWVYDFRNLSEPEQKRESGLLYVCVISCECVCVDVCVCVGVCVCVFNSVFERVCLEAASVCVYMLRGKERESERDRKTEQKRQS